jgi:uncharacterized protein YcfL
MRAWCGAVAIVGLLLVSGCGSGHRDTNHSRQKLVFTRTTKRVSLQLALKRLAGLLPKGCFVLSFNHRAHKWTVKGPLRHC